VHSTPTADHEASDRSQPTQDSSKVASLDASDLHSLFKQYPSLKAQLQQIYESTREPSENSGPYRAEQKGRPSLPRPWKPEKGFQSGLKSLQAAVDRGGADAEGMAAFLKLLAGKARPET